jgi:D-tyrosyl-tRNA(Tyr) deacylase
VFLGIKSGDTEKEAEYLMKKVANLRIFEDENGKMNLSVKDVGGEVLLVSQFTLYADCHKGNRPSFTNAGSPAYAEEMYGRFNEALKALGLPVAEGVFGADMKVELLNDGTVTIVLDSKEI